MKTLEIITATFDRAHPIKSNQVKIGEFIINWRTDPNLARDVLIIQSKTERIVLYGLEA